MSAPAPALADVVSPAPRWTQDDAALAQRARAGDADAFMALLGPLLPRALRLARRLVGDASDAEDLVQDATLRALERLDAFDPARPFAPWFLRLLFRLGLNRRASLTLRRHEPLDRADLHAATGDAAAATERAEFHTALAAALAMLSPRQRTILLLFDVDGHSGAEIATLLGITPETVRWHLHTARRAIRPALARFRSDPADAE